MGPVCGIQKFIPQGTQIEGYVLPFDMLGLESVPIKGLIHSTGSFTDVTTCPFRERWDTTIIKQKRKCFFI
jgi:hypothetical protein